MIQLDSNHITKGNIDFADLTPEQKHYIARHYQFCSNKKISREINVDRLRIGAYLNYLSLKRQPLLMMQYRKEDIISAIEEVIGLGVPIPDVSKKYKIGACTISKYVSKLFGVPKGDDTEIIIKQSKV